MTNRISQGGMGLCDIELRRVAYGSRHSLPFPVTSKGRPMPHECFLFENLYGGKEKEKNYPSEDKLCCPIKVTLNSPDDYNL